MIVKTGLLVLTNPVSIRHILPTIHKQIKNTLYIHLTSNLSEPFPKYKPDIFTFPQKYNSTIRSIYADAVALCSTLDIRVLLSGLKYTTAKSINTSLPIETIIFDKYHEKCQIDSFINNCVTNKKEDYNIWILEGGANTPNAIIPAEIEEKVYKHAVLGGTFDRLHVGHKLLLTEAVLSAEEKITVGITDACMITGKLLWELIEPCEKRIRDVQTFLCEVCGELEYNIVAIEDPYGPTKSDPSMDVIVVSVETLKGGVKVNEIREASGLKKLDINCVELIDTPCISENEEPKISSSNTRIALLGQLIKIPEHNLVKSNPYIIGLTGGIASGKSSVSNKLEKLGAEIIDCDKIAHNAYKQGKPCYKLIQEAFGDQVIAEDGEINRKVLGGIVFADKAQLERLNSIVWPAIATEVKSIISAIPTTTQKIIIVEGAVLLSAGWDKMCHEVWSCIIPPNEAIKRIQERNKLTEDEAKKRINSQAPNTEFVNKSNVILSTLWEPAYTQKIVDKAWAQLQLRITKRK